MSESNHNASINDQAAYIEQLVARIRELEAKDNAATTQVVDPVPPQSVLGSERITPSEAGFYNPEAPLGSAMDEPLMRDPMTRLVRTLQQVTGLSFAELVDGLMDGSIRPSQYQAAASSPVLFTPANQTELNTESEAARQFFAVQERQEVITAVTAAAPLSQESEEARRFFEARDAAEAEKAHGARPLLAYPEPVAELTVTENDVVTDETDERLDEAVVTPESPVATTTVVGPAEAEEGEEEAALEEGEEESEDSESDNSGIELDDDRELEQRLEVIQRSKTACLQLVVETDDAEVLARAAATVGKIAPMLKALDELLLATLAAADDQNMRVSLNVHALFGNT